MTLPIVPIPEWTAEDKPFTIGSLRNTNEGRELLVESGIWTPEQAQRAAKMQHRAPAKTRSGPFMGWDGEGLTENGRHHYVMLCNSEGQVLSRRRKQSTIPTGIALHFLCDAGLAYPDHNHVVFGGSYDTNMILTDLSYYECQELAQTGQVHWADFLIQYRPRKFLMITRYNGRHIGINREVTITLWDVIGFFQQTFVRTLKEWKIGDASDTAFVTDMKTKRSTFTTRDLKKIERYCIIECKQLVEVMTKLRNHTRALDLTPTRFDGAGAISTRIFQKYHVKQYMSRYPIAKGEWADTVPEAVNECARYAYFGGRIELVRFGNYNHTVYAHDIKSAYPYAMTYLPCLRHGHWVHNKTGRPSKHPYTLNHVKFSAPLNHRLYPLPWRAESGMVYFPPKTEGWYWQPEIDNLAHYFSDDYELIEYWSWIPECDHHPFVHIPEVYAHRQRLAKNGNLAQIILKLALNGKYGKMAQQVGFRDGKPPTYHQLEWAGYVTSFTRAAIFALAMNDPDGVIAFETDGLYATTPLTTDGDSSLGAWEVKEYSGITYVQSGVYWVNDTRGEGPPHWHAKYRGFDACTCTPEDVAQGITCGALHRDDIMAAWLGGEKKYSATSTRFRGLVASSVSPEQFVNWKQWVTEPRQLTLYPRGKRIPAYDGLQVPPVGLLRTFPTGGGSMSSPHKLAWIDAEVKSLLDEFYMEEVSLDENEDEF